ncbi:hypothetical protein [Anabaena sp. UHCC 0204]|uniref:hypothetical protein n=1 Tax=Anabaena sp. UHCC 0204 TaxID=2590009 RepID=UPI00157FC459|nr:hypothetical protein [Anabaena sp. UHCC 0204]
MVVGKQARGISKESKPETPDERLAYYLNCLPQSQGVKVIGKNVMPYESTKAFVEAVSPFIATISHR